MNEFPAPLSADGLTGHSEHRLQILIGGEPFEGELDMAAAPLACQRFLSLLPYRQRLIHVRWSGEAAWIPLGSTNLDVPLESPTSYPAPGDFLLFPGGVSETEILLAYGPTRFGSRAGQLAGSPFLRLVEGLDRLAKIGPELLWTGAKEILFLRR